MSPVFLYELNGYSIGLVTQYQNQFGNCDCDGVWLESLDLKYYCNKACFTIGNTTRTEEEFQRCKYTIRKLCTPEEIPLMIRMFSKECYLCKTVLHNIKPYTEDMPREVRQK